MYNNFCISILFCLFVYSFLVQSTTHDSIGICATVRLEGSILIEWLEYHGLIGVTNFYLYLPPPDSVSKAEYGLTLDLLKPYEEGHLNRSFKVHLFNYRHYAINTVPQGIAYQDCMHRFSTENTWLLFNDVDEFVAFPTGHHLAPVLRHAIPPSGTSDKFGGLCLTWIMLSPSPPYDKAKLARPPDALLAEIPSHESFAPHQGKLAAFTGRSNRFAGHCRFSIGNFFQHQCYVANPFIEVFSTAGERLVNAKHCETTHRPSGLALYHFFYRTCHEWVTELVPKRREYNNQLNHQISPLHAKFLPGTCSQAAKKAEGLPQPDMLTRFIPRLKERVVQHPLWGSPISFPSLRST